MFKLRITPTGTVDPKVDADYPTHAAALDAVHAFAGTAYRVTARTLTCSLRPGGVQQASYTYTIRETLP